MVTRGRTDLEAIKQAVKNEVDSIFSDEFKKQLVNTIMKKIEEKFESRIKKLEDGLASTKKQVAILIEDNRRLKSKLDSQEQYSRGRNVRIFGIDHEEGENTLDKVMDLFRGTLKINNITKNDIKSCYRVKAKNPQPEKPPAVLVQFTDLNKRAMILKSRKDLRSSQIFIKEDLTKKRLMLLGSAINKFSSKNAWCLHGNIYVKSVGDVIHRVDSIDDLEGL